MKEKPLNTALVHGMTLKTDERIIFFGEVDLLQSYIMDLTHYVHKDTLEELHFICKKLSYLMGIVAGCDYEFKIDEINHVLDLIKKYKTSKDVLTEFVLPGQTPLSAKIHIVRAVARKAELAYAKVYEKYGGQDTIFEYLNKLSTLFYELALFYEKL